MSQTERTEGRDWREVAALFSLSVAAWAVAGWGGVGCDGVGFVLGLVLEHRAGKRAAAIDRETPAP